MELRSLAHQGNNDARIALALRERGYSNRTLEFVKNQRTMAEGEGPIAVNDTAVTLWWDFLPVREAAGTTRAQYDYAKTLYQAAQPTIRQRLAATLFSRKLKEVPDDLVEAVKWLAITSYKKNGNNYSYNPNTLLNHLRRILPTNKFEEGQTRAHQWLEQHPEFASKRW